MPIIFLNALAEAPGGPRPLFATPAIWTSGIKAWRLHYTRRSDGRRRVATLGRYPGISLKQARTKAKALQATIEDAEVRADPAAEGQARRAAGTFAELADEWLDRHANPNGLFSGVAVRDLIERINGALRDGAKLVNV